MFFFLVNGLYSVGPISNADGRSITPTDVQFADHMRKVYRSMFNTSLPPAYVGRKCFQSCLCVCHVCLSVCLSAYVCLGYNF